MNIVLALCVCIIAYYVDEKSIQFRAKRLSKPRPQHAKRTTVLGCLGGAAIDCGPGESYLMFPGGQKRLVAITKVTTELAVDDVNTFSCEGLLLNDTGSPVIGGG